MKWSREELYNAIDCSWVDAIFSWNTIRGACIKVILGWGGMRIGLRVAIENSRSK